MKTLSQSTRKALKHFDRAARTSRLHFAVSYSHDDWRHRHCRIEDTLKICETGAQNVCHVYCPTIGLSTFVTFPIDQDEPTNGQIVQTLRLKLIEQTEGGV